MQANLFWQHPEGDAVKVPCRHLELVATGTTDISAPTKIEVSTKHNDDGEWIDPLGNSHKLPCLHWDVKTTTGTVQIPVYQLRPQHSAGDDSPELAPCIHPLAPVSFDAARNIVFYTNDQGFRTIATELVDRLRDRLHVRSLGTPSRPLLLFFREPVNGDPDDNTDPFWNHYNSVFHAIQITRDPNGDYSSVTASGYNSVRWQLPHELGHAIVGQSCIQAVNEGDPHSMKTSSHPGEAMSEGWANFVRVALSQDGRATPVTVMPQDFEKRDTSVPKQNDIEYNIMCILWDLYDVSTTRRARVGAGGMSAVMAVKDDDPANTDATSFSFEQLFGVFSPSLNTLPAGPIIWDVDSYLSRLKAMFPDRSSVIDAVRAIHLD